MHWIFPQIGTAFFAFGFGAIGDMAFTLVIDACPGVSEPIDNNNTISLTNTWVPARCRMFRHGSLLPKCN